MKIFITLLFCIVATKLAVSADPPAKPKTDPMPDPKKEHGEKGPGAASDDEANEAKDKAKKDITAAVGEAKVTAKTDEEKKNLDELLAKIIKAIESPPPGKGTPPTKDAPPTKPPKV